jgi:N-acetylglucosamine-6-phosphate deacetylase
MPNQVNRHHNQLLAGLAQDRLWACLITDGHHVPGYVIKMMIRAKTVDKIIVTSDASPIAGLRPGRYETLGNLAVLEKNGLLHNPQKKCLVGSSFTMLECMNYLASLKLLDEEGLLRAGYYNPLKLMRWGTRNVRESNYVELNSRTHRFEVLRSV